MENNGQITYQKVNNDDFLKEIFLEKVEMMKGSIPEGFDNEIFLSSFIKIYEYLTTKFKDVKIDAKEIPDVKRFEKRDQYTIAQFILNRIINNIDKVDVESVNDYKQTCGGYYCADEKLLRIFPITIKNVTEYEFENYKNLNFESEEDFNKMLTQHSIIHELIHAISFDDWIVGFRSNDESISINEGFTESLALEISGLGQFFKYIPTPLKGKSFYLEPKNSISSYTVETSIVDLIKTVSRKDLTIPYLICGEKTKWASINKYLDGSCYPLQGNQDVYGYLEKELFEITRKDSPLSEEEKVTRYQNLQACLLKDIIKNKYNDKFLDQVRNKQITPQQAVQFDQDLITITNRIVITFSGEMLGNIISNGAQSLEIWNLDKLKEMIKNGEIKNTENIQSFVKLMEIRYEISRILESQKEENITV